MSILIPPIGCARRPGTSRLGLRDCVRGVRLGGQQLAWMSCQVRLHRTSGTADSDDGTNDLEQLLNVEMLQLKFVTTRDFETSGTLGFLFGGMFYGINVLISWQGNLLR